VVNAGSILENDDQLGLAHFVEHTAFNGTTHFAKNDLVKYLESIGVRFGADLNAYTGFDETVYILPVPTDTARIVEKAFQILEDWAHGQVFDSTEVVNERGVVREEWRGQKGAGERMQQKWLPIAFKGSRYATRIPIGTEASIMSATPARIRSFYKDWYRPDLMAVVAVGDFNPATIEALIKKHFGSIPARREPAQAVDGGRPGQIASRWSRSPPTKKATSSSVDLMYKRPVEPIKTVADYRRSLMERLYLGMLNTRFEEITQKPDAPFLGAGASKESFFARNVEAFSLGAGVNDGGIERGSKPCWSKHAVWTNSDSCSRSWIARSRMCFARTSVPTRSATRPTRAPSSRSTSATTCRAKRSRASSTSTRSSSSFSRRSRSKT
jgi:zinc protease